MELLKLLIPALVLVGIFFAGSYLSRVERETEELVKEMDRIREILEKSPLR